MDKFDVQNEIGFKKETEKILPHEKYKNAFITASSSAFSSKIYFIVETEKILPHEKYKNAFITASSSAFSSKIYFILICSLRSQTNKKIFSSKPSSSASISAFNFTLRSYD